MVGRNQKTVEKSENRDQPSEPDVIMKVEPISVVLVVHNEAETIRTEIEAFHRKVVQKIPGSELIVAEDGSSDGTDEILKGIASRYSLKLIQETSRKGYRKALLDALRAAAREWIFFSDTGGKFDPEDFWLLEPNRESSDLVIGVRKLREDRCYRRILTRVLNRLVRLYFRFPLKDSNSGFRLYRRLQLQRAISGSQILRELTSMEITLRMLALGARLREVPVRYRQRTGPSRGLPLKKIPGVIVHTLKMFPRLKKELKMMRVDSD